MDTESWLRYLCSLTPIDWTWKVKWGITRWQGQTHCVDLLGIPLVGTFRVWPCGSSGAFSISLDINLSIVTCKYGLIDINVAVIGRASEF